MQFITYIKVVNKVISKSCQRGHLNINEQLTTSMLPAFIFKHKLTFCIFVLQTHWNDNSNSIFEGVLYLPAVDKNKHMS